jgi:hypothetical protein
MTQIKNLTSGALPFVVGGTPAEPKVEFLKPGETRSLPVKEDSPLLIGLVHVGAVAIGKDAKSAGEPAKS